MAEEADGAAPPGRVTLLQVAERAGVSMGTASAVFTRKRWVAETTRASVLDAADQLGYRHRRRAAVEPAPGVTDIGFVSCGGAVFSPANPYYALVLHGAQQACAELGAALTLEVVPPAATRLPMCVERGQVQGVLVIGYELDREYVRRIVASGTAVVLLEHGDVDLPVDVVRHDDERGGYLATRHLLDLGHTAPVPAVIAGDPTIDPVEARLAGYRRALREAGLEPVADYVRRGHLDAASGRRAALELLDLPTPPRAVFAANDESALGVLDAARDRGLAVPADLSVVGFDDVPLAARTAPPLTTVATDKELVGAQSVWHLVERIRRPGMPARRTRLGVRLLARASAARPAG